jgi:hypothetical protein
MHTLEKIIPQLMGNIELFGKYTLHSLRSTCATRLYQSGLEEQRIMEITGHSSSAVRCYKRTSDSQKEEVSAILCNVGKNALPSQSCDSTSSTSKLINIECNGSSIKSDSSKRLKIQCGELNLTLDI